ncbi:tonB-system energizer ExbB [Rhodopila sp.]|jgi:biopolymer transport protein ExbB|uniref:tonB-system energizer ExbB n=1 Tax=Rhodopila sp. TaxID=2480087 RepID=UPI002C8B522E|nr:tonB-system energizer ExbB [Rhodopila sp.]HVZ07618.1 tonB-system energizer ExbB [Rhodopila sp.]
MNDATPLPDATAALPPVPLTPWQMFMHADLVVQCVMVILLLASVITWTILLAKGIEMVMALRGVSSGLRILRKGGDVAALPTTGSGAVAHELLSAAEAEAHQSAGLPPEGIKDRIALRLRRIELAMARRLGRGTGILASIGSCGPFVGLFGTVWGIMDSFVHIAATQTTSLAVVAPGIAEALLATAFGLMAAIPAVLVYNLFARLLGHYRAALGDLGAFVLAHAARELDRAHQPPPANVIPVLLRPAAE